MTRPRPDGFFDAYIFDMDGTIYLGDGLLPGAKRLIDELRRRQLPVRFLTNNPTKDRREYAEKLSRLGLPTAVDDIINTVVVMVDWLRRNHPNAVVYPIAERPLRDALLAAGFTISDDPAQIDIVIASYDRGFDYSKLQIAFDALWFYKRAILVATNPDRFCPMPGGHGEPDCAAIVAAIEACAAVSCTKTTGKPDPAMLDAALAGLEVDPQRAIIVGDRLATDIRLACDAGAASALTLTGENNAEDLNLLPAERHPDFVLARIDHLIPAWAAAELGWDDN